MPATLKNIIVFEDRLEQHGTFWKYMRPEFAQHLENYLPVFEKYRSAIGIVPGFEDWKTLPFGNFAKDNSWQWRRQSLSLFQKLTEGRSFENTLEIGSWNGWLTKYLAKNSETVMALDYFTHPLDGISNLSALAPNITAVQSNLGQTGGDFKPQTFDLIVLNHCLSYTQNPESFLKNLMPLLRPNGIMVSLGNTFYRNPEKKIQQNEIFAQRFRQQYHLEVFIQPVKGFMDGSDKALLQQAGVAIRAYRAKFLQNLYARLNPYAPEYVALIYENH